MLDVDFARSCFPGLATPWALLDNAGGSLPARGVVARVAEHMERRQVQLGATYPLSAEAGRAVAAGRAAAARLLGAGEDEVVIGASTTTNVRLVADAFGELLAPGDEVVVTDLDHESHVGAWRALEARGAVVREWKFDRGTQRLELADLEPLLGPRTRLVACTHVSNVVGAIHDVRAIADRVHAVGARLSVDGVAFAPHRRVDARALGADLYFVSAYKVYGPHVGLAYVEPELLRSLPNRNHFFYGPGDGAAKLEPGGVTHELVAGLPGTVEYLASLARTAAEASDPLAAAFAAIANHEQQLAAPLVDWLARHPRVRLYGPPTADSAARAPTIAFTVDGLASSALVRRLEESRLGLRFGHFYALRAIRALGLADEEGVVRASLVHYNSTDEVARLCAALEDLVGAV